VRRAALVAVAALCLHSAPARAADALDAYRALPRAERMRVLACARAAIERACAHGDSTHTAADAPDSLAPDWPGSPCGVYLSLARGRSTRACVGSLMPLGGTLAATLRELARRVVSDDPRHPPVRREELDTLAVCVSFAGLPESVADPMAVAPAREGLLIASPVGSIAFLPGEARTISWALSEARRVGLLERSSEASYERFPVVVVRDDPGSRIR
jgi:AMMECR1 domain-containing protein